MQEQLMSSCLKKKFIVTKLAETFGKMSDIQNAKTQSKCMLDQGNQRNPKELCTG